MIVLRMQETMRSMRFTHVEAEARYSGSVRASRAEQCRGQVQEHSLGECEAREHFPGIASETG
jgi:hypothetical protein